MRFADAGRRSSIPIQAAAHLAARELRRRRRTGGSEAKVRLPPLWKAQASKLETFSLSNRLTFKLNLPVPYFEDRLHRLDTQVEDECLHAAHLARRR